MCVPLSLDMILPESITGSHHISDKGRCLKAPSAVTHSYQFKIICIHAKPE